jgi:hypothetical protein
VPAIAAPPANSGIFALLTAFPAPSPTLPTVSRTALLSADRLPFRDCDLGFARLGFDRDFVVAAAFAAFGFRALFAFALLAFAF